MDDVQLYVDGQKFEGWKEVTVSRSLTAVSGKFELSITDSWAITKSMWSLAPGKSCILKIGNDTIMTGFIDGLEAGARKDQRTISVSGRDKTADLVDCSLPPSTISYGIIDFFTLAKKIAKPFGIEVINQTNVGAPIPTEVVQMGETAYAFLEKTSRKRGIVMTTDGLGRLLLIKIGALVAKTALIEGQNLEDIRIQLDYSQRFSSYLIRSQIPQDQDTSIAFSQGIDGSAKDPGVLRFRQLLIIAEEALIPTEATKRIQWEAAFRAAESSVVNVEVPGWRQTEGGDLWQPNMKVNVDSPIIGVQQELLIGDVVFSLTESGGQVTKMKLLRADAYIPKPEIDHLGDWTNAAASQ